MIVFVGFKGVDLKAFSGLFDVLRRRGLAFEICPEPADRSSAEQASPAEWPMPELLLSGEAATAELREPYRRVCAAFDPERLDEVEMILSRRGAKLCVWCPGQITGLIGRAAARRLGLPLACLLPPFFEFKTLQPFSCPAGDPTEWYIAAGSLGTERFVRAGARREQIVQMGSPRFETFVERLAKESGLDRRDEVLVPLQSESGEPEMIDIVRAWAERSGRTSLAIRPHPSLPGLESPYSRLPVRIATEGLDEAFRRAFAVVSRNSMVLLEAILAGIPAIAWQDSDLPAEMTFAGLRGLEMVHGRSELESALESALRAQSPELRAEYAAEAKEVVLPAGGRPTERIAEFLTSLVR